MSALLTRIKRFSRSPQGHRVGAPRRRQKAVPGTSLPRQTAGRPPLTTDPVTLVGPASAGPTSVTLGRPLVDRLGHRQGHELDSIPHGAVGGRRGLPSGSARAFSATTS